MKKNILIILISCLSITAFSQSNTTVSYGIGFGTADLNDFISNTSFRGVSIDYRKLVQPNLGIGFTLGWNVFYEDLENDTYTIENISITGKQYRYGNYVPVMLAASYYHNPGETIVPFAGIGVGTIYSHRRTDMNRYQYQRTAWNFAFQPEIGVLISSNPDNAVSISAKYNHGFQAGNELDEAQSYLSLNIGLIFY